ncbi:MAG TPA: ABC transporter ATP-binding protein [Streptosporangiaceae bacterium]|jgi:ABC-2 type transport system ATP-binding protein
MPSAAVEITDLAKRYGAVPAVRGVTWSARRGEITALLGPNGAGKTTTVEICEGFRRADSGRVAVLGLDPRRDAAALKARIGVMLQSAGVPTAARTGEWLRLVAKLYAHPAPVDALLDRLGLAAVARTPFKRLSGGQQQRLSLAAAVVGRPELVFLDEPTAGLDPQARHATWELVGELRAAGVSVVLTTHYMEEAERLADRVVIIDEGRVVADAPPGRLTADRRRLRFRAEPGLTGLSEALPAGHTVTEAPPGRYEVDGPEPDGVGPDAVSAVTAWCARHSITPDDLRLERRTLEDVFLDLTGRDLRS